MRHNPLYHNLHTEEFSLFPDFAFLPKVVLAFHLQATINLLTFSSLSKTLEELRLHTLGIKGLFFVIKTNNVDCKGVNLFVASVGLNKGHAVSSQRSG